MKAKFPSLLLPITFLLAQNSFAEVKIITNKHRNIKIPITEITREESNQNIYDLSFVAYDKSFAEEFGLKEELVTTMDKGLRFLEVKMITEGKETNCHYNLVLDKSVEVAFPKNDNFILDNHPSINFNEILIRSVDEKELIEKNKHLIKLKNIPRKSENIGKYDNRLRISNQDYRSDRTPRASNGSFINYYIQDRLNYQILSIRGNCYFDANVFEIPKPSIWVAAKKLDYGTIGINPDNYNRFLIPETISKQFAPIVLEFQKSVNEARRVKEEEPKKSSKKSFFNF